MDSFACNAYALKQVANQIPLKIESVAIFDDTKLIAGTAEGAFLIYGEENGSWSPINSKKCAAYEKKAIVQLDVFQDRGSWLVARSGDGVMTVHTLPDMDVVQTIDRLKGANIFAVSREVDGDGNVVLGVGVKKRLFFFTWNADNAQFVPKKTAFERAIPDSAKLMLFAGENLCLGFRREYSLLRVETGTTTELFSTGKNHSPIGTVAPRRQLLLMRDNEGIFVDFDGRPTKKFAITWSESPISIVCTFPYMIASLSKCIEVRRVAASSSSLVQTIPCKGTKILIPGEKDCAFTASSFAIQTLQPVEIEAQVDELVREKKYEGALSLCSYVETEQRGEGSPIDMSKKLKAVHQSYAYHMFVEGQYGLAFNHFDEANVEVGRILALFPSLLPRGVKLNNKHPVELPQIAGNELELALSSLIPHLRAKRSHLTPDDHEILSILDTVLLRAFLLTNAEQLLPFLNEPNYCLETETEKLLLHYKKFHELVIFYRSRELHENALDLLTKIEVSTGGDKESGIQEIVSYLQTLGSAHQHLVFQHSKRIFQSDPEMAFEIFVHPSAANCGLDQEEVFKHIDAINPRYCDRYAEYVVSEGAVNPLFHNRLALSYLQRRQDEGEERLLRLLKDSRHYNPEFMLTKLPPDAHPESRATLLSRLGRHDEALRIYAHIIKDTAVAERYCLEHYNPDRPETRDVFMELFRCYLQPPDENSHIMLAAAQSLLSDHYDKINGAQALEMLSNDITLKQLGFVLEALLRHNTERRKNSQVVRSLLKGEALQIRNELVSHRAHVIKIGGDDICPVCSKRLGNTVFVRNPDATIVHFACSKER